MKKIISIILIILFATNIYAIEMVEVSVEAIEIKSTVSNDVGLAWGGSATISEALNKYDNYPNLSGGATTSILSVPDFRRASAISATLKALISKNNAKIIANPKLATESGSQASFVVGGEIPVPVASPQGVSIEWKSYGINLQIKPSVNEKSNEISAMIQVSVSDLDYANAVKLQGYDIPALLNRSANSKVTVPDGGTAIIAGLKQNRKETTDTRVPFFGSIPLIGWLFKSKAKRDSETSMVVFVTFKRVKIEKAADSDN